MRDFHIDLGARKKTAFRHLSIDVKGQSVTEHFNENEEMERYIVVDPLPLAEWFAANWWRIRWEPEKENLNPEQQLDWNLSHCLASAGAGFVWPNVTLVSDDFSLNCRTRKTSGEFATLQYSRELNEWLKAEQFEAGVDEFLNTVANLHPHSNLFLLWSELLAERKDEDATQWRKLEAKAGYDAGEAPEELIEGLQNYYSVFGKASVEELSSENHDTSVLGLARELELTLKSTSEAMRPDLKNFKEELASTFGDNLSPPWKQAEAAASWLRRELGLEVQQPVNNSQLFAYLDVSDKIFSSATGNVPMSVGLKEDTDRIAVHINSARETAQRFALSRLLGDHLYTYGRTDSHLLSVGHSKTRRQKFQRAFAQELLCPYQGLLENMGTTQPNEESLERMADFFQVSPLTVRYTLENRQPSM